MSVEDAEVALRRADLYDEGLLKEAAREQLSRALRNWRGAKIALVKGELSDYRSLWGRLGLDRQENLLLICNGQRWEAKGWGLEPAEITRRLEAAEAALAADKVEGLKTALAGLQKGAFGPSDWLPYAAGAGTFTAVVLGVAGLAFLHRRGQLIAERKAAYDEAKAMVEEEYAAVVLAADGIPANDPLWDHAQRLKRGLVALSKSEEDPEVIRGKAEHYQAELAALRTRLRTRSQYP
jgi:hypothetical protein